MPSSGVCLPVCPSRSCIVSKRIYISSNLFHRRVATPFYIFCTKRHGNIPTKRGLTLYTVTVDVNRVYDSKAGRYAEDNEQNRIVHTGKYEAEVTNNKKTALEVYCTIETNY